MTEPTPDPIRVVLIEDHDFYRAGLKKMLMAEGIHVVGDASTGEEGVRLVQRAKPDLVISDLHMPGISGVEATERILAADPDARVVVLSVSTESEDVLDALLAGASGYLLKDATIAEIVGAVRTVAAGEQLLSPDATAKVVGRLREHAEAAKGQPPADIELSEREADVLRLVAQGLDNSQIGKQLYISPTTVKHHVSNLLAKLGVENRIQAAVYAAHRGMV